MKIVVQKSPFLVVVNHTIAVISVNNNNDNIPYSSILRKAHTFRRRDEEHTLPLETTSRASGLPFS